MTITTIRISMALIITGPLAKSARGTRHAIVAPLITEVARASPTRCARRPGRRHGFAWLPGCTSRRGARHPPRRGHWIPRLSLLDNSVGRGYTQRFGLVHVDFDTLVRTPKRSYEWLRQVISARGPV